MSKSIEFFYDYVSSYSYLANHEVGRLEGVEVHYRPFFLGAVMKATGNRPPGSVPAKGAYLVRDLKRWADRYGIGFKFNSVFPQNTLTALRLALVAMERGEFQLLHQELFEAMFVDDRDLSDPDTLREILSSSGLDADACLADADGEPVKAALKANTEEAIGRGAFGAPTIFVGEEMFFGNDRFDFVLEALERQESVQ